MAQRNIAKPKPIKTLLEIRDKDRKLSYDQYLQEVSLPDKLKKLARKKN